MKRLFFLLCVAVSFGLKAQGVLFPVEIRGKWGYTDAAGKMIIPARYDYAGNFYEGRAVVALNNQPCVIDVSDKRIIDTGLYINISRFSEGLARVTDVKQVKSFVDYNGRVVFVLPPEIYDAQPFRNGLSCVAKNVELHEQKFGRDIVNLGYKFGYINKKGEIVIACKYDDADDFFNGYARFREGTRFGFFDSTGNVAVRPVYTNLGKFYEGKAVADVNGRFGFVDTRGQEVIRPQYEYAYDFSEELAAVRVSGKYGYIDASGTMVIQPEYEMVRPFSEGVAAVRKEGKWGFIDKKGKPVLRFVFDDASFFMEGRCAVLIRRRWGFIDATGALVIPAEFDAVGSFSNGLAEVMRGSISVYVDKRGSIIPKLN